MKKALSCLLVVLMLVGLSVPAWADNGVQLISAVDASNVELTDHVTLTLYKDRGILENSAKEALEAARKSLAETKDLRTLCEELEQRVIDGTPVVTALFDLSADEKVSFPITVKVGVKNLDTLIALVHFVGGDAAWEWVPVELLEDESAVSFTVDSLSPFALISIGGEEEDFGEETEVVPGTPDTYYDSANNPGAPAMTVTTPTESDGEDAVAFVLTKFNDADSLPAALKALLLEAYDSLVKAEDLTALNEQLKELADGRELGVSDVFDIRAIGEAEFPAELTLKDQFLENFVALMHYVDGAWELVETTVVGNEISFTVDSLSPFAIIVAVENAQ